VIAGTSSCATSPHTDTNGYWVADVPLATPTLYWDVRLQKAGFFDAGQRFLLLQGQTVVYVVPLQPAS